MTYAQIMKNVPASEADRRMAVVTKMNLLWDKRNACDDESQRKVFDKKINVIRRAEASWMREVAWFLY